MEQEVTFRNELGLNLYGVLVDHDQSSSDKVMIICHGLLANSSWRWIPTLSHIICQRLSCRVFRFDFTGNGASQGPWNYGAYRSQVNDLHAAVQYLIEQSLKPIAIIGHSMGADVALLYAASSYSNVNHIVNISGRFNMQLGVFDKFSEAQLHDLYEDGSFYWRIGKRTLIVTKETLDERLDIDMSEEMKNIPEHIAVLTVHGTNDEVVHIADSRQWDNYIKNHTLIELEGCDHNFSGGNHVIMISRIVDWLGQQIGGRQESVEVDLAESPTPVDS